MAPAYDRAVSGAQLLRDLRALGVRPGGIAMVHSSLSQLGWVMGGAETLARALFEAIGPGGTLVAYLGWEDEPPMRGDPVPPETWARIHAEFPVYDPRFARARRDHGRLPELLRTWPGAMYSEHPESGIVAIGPRAAEIVHPHPFDFGFGAESPYARLAAFGAQILHIGSPLDTTTLIHHAETIADVPNKVHVSYEYPILNESGDREWRVFHDINTSVGCLPYEQVTDQPYVEHIATLALAAGHGRQGAVGYGTGYCFEAGPLVSFAVEWIERHFGNAAPPSR